MRIGVFLIISVLIVALFANGCATVKSDCTASEVREKCLDIIRQGIDSENVIYAVHAAEALSIAGEYELVREKFQGRLKLEEDEKMRCCIARELVRAGLADYADILFDVLKDPNAIAYAHAAEAIYKVDIQVDASILKNALNYTKVPIDKLWLQAAILKTTNQGQHQLRDLLYADNLLIASVAALILGETGNLSEEDANYLIANIKSFCSIETAILYTGFWNYDEKQAQKALFELSFSSDPAVKAFAAYSLRHSKSNGTICALVRLLDDENEDVRIRSAHSLLSMNN